LALDGLWRLSQGERETLLRTRLGTVDHLRNVVAVTGGTAECPPPSCAASSAPTHLIDQRVCQLYGLTQGEIA
jgi:hypothetical protein